MNIFESINDTSNKATNIGEQYLEKTQEYFKLKVFHQVSYVISMLGKALAVGSVLFMGLIFLAVASAIAIGDLLGNIALGYVIVGAIFIVAAIIIYSTRHLIDSAIIKKIQSKIFK